MEKRGGGREGAARGRVGIARARKRNAGDSRASWYSHERSLSPSLRSCRV